jgi:hypothetical protein
MQGSAQDDNVFAGKHAWRCCVGDRGGCLLRAVALAAAGEDSNPSVTYEYRGDQELLQAQQNAVTFCNQYGSAPRPARFTTGSNGQSDNVVFACDPSLARTAPRQQALDPNLNCSYRTDQELLDASWSAQAYCMNNGSQRAGSNIRTNADGSRTMMFQCTPR